MTDRALMDDKTILAERARDYATLGRFLGLADMAAEPDSILTDRQLRERVIEILREYKEKR